MSKATAILIPLLFIVPGCLREQAELSPQEFGKFIDEVGDNPQYEEVRESFTEWAEEKTPGLLEIIAEDPKFGLEDFSEFQSEFAEGDYDREEARETVEEKIEDRLPAFASGVGSDEVVSVRVADRRGSEDHIRPHRAPTTGAAVWSWMLDLLTMFVVGLAVGLLWWTVGRAGRRR